VLNALWSIYIRRYLRMPSWEVAQIALGLAIPPLLIIHVIGTKVADDIYGTDSTYASVLASHWLGPPFLLNAPSFVYLHIAAILVVWIHACIGLHFWLRTKRWYATWLPTFATLAIVIPALSLAGYISGGNQIVRDAQDPDFVPALIREARVTPEIIAKIWRD